ncbi:hypothetical protein K2Z83_02125 [Oscillochloris sp. ZM17-4]|uniref:clostripain-related cysteine peptidase n=1 Tax=Oscillochloris sp. ZM17-4 TaxID=2866714 RepID=UPI001C73488C|nr:clostripain-related cysteine peptidase [Oscillochloris sp. ZM17-4]MBX0326490.1 hypothetical protein [Oscillochloris sp. ZM17-4]
MDISYQKSHQHHVIGDRRSAIGYAHRLCLLLLLLALLPPGAQAQSGPSMFLPGAAPPTPPAFTQGGADSLGPQLAAAAQACLPALTDSTVDTPAATTPWKSLRSSVSIVSDQSYSAPQAIFAQAGGGGVVSTGQDVAINAGASAIYGGLWYRYAAGSTLPGDRLQVEIYQVGTVSTNAPVASVNTAVMADDAWHLFSWSVTDATKLATLRGLGAATFAVTMRNATGGATRQLWVDDIEMDVCLPGIDGSVRAAEGGAAVAGAQVLLARNTAAGSTIIASAASDAAGAYSFTGVPALGAGETYQVWFLNAPASATRPDSQLGFWAGPTISASRLLAQPTYTVPDLVVGDVALSSPDSYSTVAATNNSPVRLSWAGRGVANETYQLCVYDPQRIDPATSLPTQVCGKEVSDPSLFTFDLSPKSFDSVPSFGFSYGRSYRWYVVAYGADGQQYGYSFYERAITLATESISPPAAAVTPSATLPAASSAVADWTLMLYAAGDNPLGDTASATRMSPLGRQIAQLRDLAAAYPKLHIVTLSDSYGDTGAQLCHLPPTGQPDCQERGEISTGDPAVLGDFVKTALARYPANHTMLIIAGPGDPIGGLGYDLTTPGAPAIDTVGLRAAFAAAGLGAGKRLDLIFYQVPLMGTIEVAAASAPYARYMVAAADEYWTLPVYSYMLPMLAGAQKDQPAQVAKSMAGIYSAAIGGTNRGLSSSIAAYDLGQAAAVDSALESLGTELQSALISDSSTVRAALRRIRQGAAVYDSSGNGLINQLEQRSGEPVSAQEDSLIDLRRLATAIQADLSLPQMVRDTAGDLAGTISGGTTPLMLTSLQISGVGTAGYPVSLSGTNGLSVFFPNGARLGGQQTMVQRYLYGASGAPRDSAWAAFLRSYLAREIGRGPGGVTTGPQGGAQLRGPVGGVISFDLFLPLTMR